MEEEFNKAHEELAKLSVAETIPSSNGDAIHKENINVVFIGHVDAGKSTIGGHLLVLTGMVDKRTLEKFERESKEMGRESWFLSWALDTGDEERAKGITVECGRAHFETAKRRVTVLDAPGHKNYVPSMISGAAQADVAILVISARKGEFETGFEKGGQTREHAMLVKSCGVKRILVAINKMDDPTVEWSQARYEEIRERVLPFLKAQGFSSKDIFFMPISGFTGANLKDPLGKAQCSWWSEATAGANSIVGLSLLDFLDTLELPERRHDAPFLMPISGKYRELGTIVTGKVESGSIRKGQSLIILPSRQPVEVLAINIEEAEVGKAICGDNVRLRLKGVEEEEVSVGFVVCDAAAPIKAATQFTAQLLMINIRNIVAPGFKAVMHIHTASEEVTLASFEYMIDRKTGDRLPKRNFAKQNDCVVATIEANAAICMDTEMGVDAFTRFTLRDEGKTIAVGKILSIKNDAAGLVDAAK